jgi:predicted TIM-barrel fold metal-dependent hydrolase
MIDTHVHHWELGRFQCPWLADAAFDDLRKDYSPADYRADAAELPVDGWVHIQAEVDHQLDPVAETAWVESLAEEASAAGLPVRWHASATPTCGLRTCATCCRVTATTR